MFEMDREIIKLNVGGTKYVTFSSTIVDTLIDTMINSKIPTNIVDDHIFIDRDGDLFRHVLNYSRTEEITCDEKDIHLLAKELDYFSISHSIKNPEEELFERAYNILIDFRYGRLKEAPFLIKVHDKILLRKDNMTDLISIFEEKLIQERFVRFLVRYGCSIKEEPMYGGKAWFIY